MSQSVGLKCLDKYGFPLAGLTTAEQAVRTEAAARETKLQEKWSRQVGPPQASYPEGCLRHSYFSVLASFLSISPHATEICYPFSLSVLSCTIARPDRYLCFL